jgi:alpha-aminoadipate carrier protein LysW
VRQFFASGVVAARRHRACFGGDRVLANQPRLGLDILRCNNQRAVVEVTRDNHGGINAMPRGTCPECEAEVQVDEDTDKGDVVECDDCGTQLEVVGLDPIELDVAVAEEEEEWDET